MCFLVYFNNFIFFMHTGQKFDKLGQFVSMSLAQGGNGFPFFGRECVLLL